MEEKIRPIIGATKYDYEIDNENYVVSLIRAKDNRHGLLVLEGLDEKNQRAAWHIDLVVKRGGTNTLDKSLPEKTVSRKTFFGYSAKIVKETVSHAPLPTQKAEIRINPIQSKDQWDVIQTIDQDFIYQSYPITLEQAQTLLANAHKDKNADDIFYNFSGDGCAHSASFSGKRYHSCISWAMHMLTTINIEINSSWHNWFIVIPECVLPNASPRQSG